MGKIVNLFNDNVAHASYCGVSTMDVEAFRVDLVRPALKVAGLWSEAAENLLVGTALVESGLKHVVQIKSGAALSFMQIEKPTYLDCIRYLKRPDKRNLKEAVLSACFIDVFPSHDAIIWNLRLAILMARIKYWMIPKKLPEPDDSAELCNYYLDYYNTHFGKSTFEKSIPHFIKACE